MTVVTLKPVAGANSPVDGYALTSTSAKTLALIRSTAGTSASSISTSAGIYLTSHASTLNTYDQLVRSFLCFDTSAIPAGSTIISATISIYGDAKTDGLGSGTLGVGVSSAFLSSTSSISASNYVNVSSVLASDYVSYDSFDTSGYNVMTLNSAGRSNITMGGVSKFAVRLSWDIDNSFGGTWAASTQSGFTYWQADKGAGYEPILTINYSLADVVSAKDIVEISITSDGVTSTKFTTIAGNNSPVDGFTMQSGSNQSFATLRAAAGSSAYTTYTYAITNLDVAFATTPNFTAMSRSIYCFDTTSIPANVTITSAVLSLYGQGKSNALGPADLHVASASPASTSTLAAEDYQTCGTTSLGSISYASFSTAGYNDITLNASGIASIVKGGISKFSTRLSWDINNSFTGTWAAGQNSSFSTYPADYTTSNRVPTLTVTYTHDAPPQGALLFFM